MSRTIEQVREELDAKIPRDVISERSNGGMTLSYLEGWYVIDRLNKVFGQGNWSYETKKLEKVFEGSVTGKTGKVGRAVSYLATINLTVSGIQGSGQFSFTDVGAGKGIDYNQGLEADESAAKEAVTDGLKRCAKNLGMSMGLALYDKSQENVTDDAPEPPRAKEAITSTPTSAAPKTNIVPFKTLNRDGLNKLISETSRVVIARKRGSLDDIKGYMQDTYKTDKKEELSHEHAQEFLGYLEKLNA